MEEQPSIASESNVAGNSHTTQRSYSDMDITDSPLEETKIEEQPSIASESNVAGNSHTTQRSYSDMNITDSPLEETKIEELPSIASESNVNPTAKQRKLQIKCKLCGKMYRNKQHHMKAYHKGFVKAPLPLKLACTICGKVVSRTNMSKHKKIHTPENVECDICHYKTKAKRNLRQHMSRHAKAAKKEEFERLLDLHSLHSDTINECNEKIRALKNDAESTRRMNNDSVQQLQEQLSLEKKQHEEAVVNLTRQVNALETMEKDLRDQHERTIRGLETSIDNISENYKAVLTEIANERLNDQMEVINDMRREKGDALSALNLKLEQATAHCSELQSRNDRLIQERKNAELQLKQYLVTLENVTLENEKLKAQLQQFHNVNNADLCGNANEPDIIVVDDSDSDSDSDSETDNKSGIGEPSTSKPSKSPTLSPNPLDSSTDDELEIETSMTLTML